MPGRFLCKWRIANALCVAALSSQLPVPGAAERAVCSLTVQAVKCESALNPIGIGEPNPCLSWKLESGKPGQRQTAYHVLAASNPDLLRTGKADLWDSGKVASDQCSHIPYAGKALRSNQTVYWKAAVWDIEDRQSDWFAPASWTMGIVPPSDWKAKWIGSGIALDAAETSGSAKGHRPLPLFRKDFQTSQPVRRALIHISGLGHHSLYLDGAKVGQQFLDPPWSQYEKTVYYATHDITDALRQPGSHTFGVMLGKGFYNNKGNRRIHGLMTSGPLMVLAQAHLEFADGSEQILVTDGSWRWMEGPLLHDAILAGTDYDARRLPDGWASPGLDLSAWQTAKEVDPPGGTLSARIGPAMKEEMVFRSPQVSEPAPGYFVYDFGQNASALPSFSVSGKAGQTFRIGYAEQRHGSSPRSNDGKGRIDPAGIGQPAYIEYTLRGVPDERWSPPFFYSGFQYLEVSGAVPEGRPNPGGLPELRSLDSHHVRAAAGSAGSFHCSSPLLEETDRMIDWSVRSNLGHVLTDCPHREKLGWLEVAHLMWPSMAARYDLETFARKIARDMRDAQEPDGKVPTVAPDYSNFTGGFRYTPEWGAAAVFVPWQSYVWYGGKRILEENYECMRRFTEFMERTAKDHVPIAGLGDWYDYGHGQPPGPSRFTPVDLSAMATYHECARTVERTATVLGKESDAKRFRALAAEIRKAFNARFFDGKCEYKNNGSCQTANAMALCMGLVEDQFTTTVVEKIVEDLRVRNWQQTAGDVGHCYVIRALAEHGRSDILWKVYSRTGLGSYGCLVRSGWNSLPETWNAERGLSMNHCMLGHIQEWFTGWLGGVRPDPEAPGFKHFFVSPSPVGDLTSASVSYQSPYGTIVGQWKLDGGKLDLEVTVPPGSSATVMVPAASPADVTDGAGKPARETAGLKALPGTTGRAVFEAVSGRYRLVSQIGRSD